MNDENLPIAKPYGIDDGYGIIGVGFSCEKCDASNWFMKFTAGDNVTCKYCGQDHYCVEDYDY